MSRDSRGPVPMQEWERLREYQARCKEVQEWLAGYEHLEADEDRLVGVALGPGGKLSDLEITAEAMSRFDPEELADRILNLYDSGCAAMEEEIQTETKRLLGVPLSPEALAEGRDDR